METWIKVQLASTDHIAALHFSDNGSPSKRASENLIELERLKLIEGKRMELSKPKVWRLTKRGRDYLQVTRAPIPLSGFKVDHHLAITSCYVDLQKSGKLLRFISELREPFAEGKKIYAPDAFIVYDAKPYLLEVQRSPLSTARWAKKWAVASEYFDGNFHTKASFQYWKGKIIRPKILVVSSQKPDNIAAGTRLPLIIRDNLLNFQINA